MTATDKPTKQPFKRYPVGYFHIDIAEVRTDEGKLHLFVAVDRTCKFAFVELHPAATVQIATDFLSAVIAPLVSLASASWKAASNAAESRSGAL